MGQVDLHGCRFTINRRITDLERSKKVLGNCLGKDIHAHLSAQLRLESLTYRNTRDAARRTTAGIKLKNSGPRPQEELLENALHI